MEAKTFSLFDLFTSSLYPEALNFFHASPLPPPPNLYTPRNLRPSILWSITIRTVLFPSQRGFHYPGLLAGESLWNADKNIITRSRLGEMGHWVMAWAAKSDDLSSILGPKSNAQGCPLTYTHILYTHTHTHTHTYTPYTHTYTHTYKHIRIHTPYTHIHTHHIDTHTHTPYTHIHTHTI
jgi:hypothetical protein